MSETHKATLLIGDWVIGDTLESCALVPKQQGTLQVPKPDISLQREEGPVLLRLVSLAALSSTLWPGTSNPSSCRSMPITSAPPSLGGAAVTRTSDHDVSVFSL